MKLYLDSVFLLNVVINYLLLLVSARVAGEPVCRGWLAVGAAVGGFLAAAAFLPGCIWLSHPLCKLCSGGVMLTTSFWYSRRLVRVGMTFLALSCMLGGGILLLSLLTGRGVSFQGGILGTGMDLKLVLVSALFCAGILYVLFLRAGKHGTGELLPVTLSIGGRNILLTALRDTGNTLSDPATGKSVLVAEGAKLKTLLPEYILSGLERPAETMERCFDPQWRKRLRLLPYRAVGVRCGFLLAVRTDRVQIGKKEYSGLLVALSPTPVSDGGGYQVLVGE